MKKFIYLIAATLITGSAIAQVGIRTQNPQRELHIAEPESKLRVDGLNATNQNNNTTKKGVYADNNGTLVTTEDVKVIYEFKSNGTNSNVVFPRDTMYVKTTQIKTTKKIGNDLNFTNNSDGILFISFQPKLSLKDTPLETFSNESARNYGIKMVIKDQNNNIIHQVTKHSAHHSAQALSVYDQDCIDNTTDPDSDLSECIKEYLKTIDLNLNLSTTAFIPAGDYKIEFYGFGYRSNDIYNSGTSTTIDTSSIPYIVTYDHDEHSELNVYVIHP